MMNIEDVREYCLSLPNTTEDMPFGDDILCLRVDGRIFALLWLGWPDTHIALKCNPDIATALREQYRADDQKSQADADYSADNRRNNFKFSLDD